MTIAGLFLFILFCLLGAYSWRKLPDPISPDKIFLVFSAVFFFDIFLSDYASIYYLIYIVLLLSIFLGIEVGTKSLTATERNRLTNQVFGILEFKNTKIIYITLAIMALPGIWAQFYLINLFGGMEGYIRALGNRVLEFQGLGNLKLLITSSAAVVIFYFTVLLSDRNSNRLFWLIWAFLFVAVIGIGFLSASRGKLLGNFVVIIIIAHYTIKRIRPTYLLGAGIIILIAASILGVMRGGYRYTDGSFVTGLSKTDTAAEMFKTTWTTYGLMPLELVLESEEKALYLGATYVTVITNLIPREIWPDKPPSGGIVITEEYAGDAWGGLSYLATGIFPEAIINFGIFGIFIGAIQLFLLVWSMIWLYRSYINNLYLLPVKRVLFSVIYAKVLLLSANYLSGEFTKSTIAIMLWIVIVYFIYYFLKIFLMVRINR